jgi:hypothetical protein
MAIPEGSTRRLLTTAFKTILGFEDSLDTTDVSSLNAKRRPPAKVKRICLEVPF